MTIDNDVSLILRELERSSDKSDVWGNEAARIADGIKSSGLVTEIAGFRNDVGSGLLTIATVMGVATREIASQIAESNTYLSRMTQALENPRATSASEMRKRGATALRNDWPDDAVKELEASIADDPFSVKAYLMLASAYQQLGRADDAVGALRSAMKYVRPQGPGTVAGVALAASTILVEADRRDAAIEILDAVDREYPSCAEVALRLGILRDDVECIERALSLEPGLAVIAMAVAPEPTESAVTAVVRGEGGMVVKIVELRESVRELRGLSDRFILNIFPEEIDRFEDLPVAEQWLIATDLLTAFNPIVSDAREEMAKDESADKAAVKEEQERLRWDFSITERPIADAATQRAQARADALERLGAIHHRSDRVIPWSV
jgi:tetratricopeptide (TPR) repeat protein